MQVEQLASARHNAPLQHTLSARPAVSPSGLTSVLPSVGLSPSLATAKYTNTCTCHMPYTCTAAARAASLACSAADAASRDIGKGHSVSRDSPSMKLRYICMPIAVNLPNCACALLIQRIGGRGPRMPERVANWQNTAPLPQMCRMPNCVSCTWRPPECYPQGPWSPARAAACHSAGTPGLAVHRTHHNRHTSTSAQRQLNAGSSSVRRPQQSTMPQHTQRAATMCQAQSHDGVTAAAVQVQL